MENVTLTFDKVVKTEYCFVPGIELLQVLGDVGTSVLETKKRDTIDVKNLHEFLVIAVKLMQGLLERHMIMKLLAKFDVCEAFSIGKSRQKNINKKWKVGSSIL
jgi:hypothetical protein